MLPWRSCFAVVLKSQDFTRDLFFHLRFTGTTASPNPAPINLLEFRATSCRAGEGKGLALLWEMWPCPVRTWALRVLPGLCSGSGVSRAVWCPSHPAGAGALGACCNGLMGAFLMSEMGKSWVEGIAYKFFSYDSSSFLSSSLLVFLDLPWSEGWVTKSNGLLWEEPWAASREGPGSGGWLLGSRLWPPGKT